VPDSSSLEEARSSKKRPDWSAKDRLHTYLDVGSEGCREGEREREKEERREIERCDTVKTLTERDLL
jgi:hypothetical protein